MTAFSAFVAGLKCKHSFAPKLVSVERIQDAIDLLLGMQNSHGGLGTYELTRGSRYLELLNPAEVFGASIPSDSDCQRMTAGTGDIMIEYAYPECTTAFLTALCLFTERYSDYRQQDIACVCPFLYAEHLPTTAQTSTSEGDWLYSHYATERRQLVRLLGNLLHLRHHVRPRIARPGWRDVRELAFGAEGMRILVGEADGRWRMGRVVQGASALFYFAV